MMGENNTLEATADEKAEVLYTHLMHLKQYETPDPDRMRRNRQNIMREVRKARSEQKKPLLDLMEINIPWFFAEPKYGIAAVFVAFVGLQYLGTTARTSSRDTGIYTTGNIAALEQSSTISTNNSYSYPTLPDNYQLFTQPDAGNASVVPAGFEFRK
jgi:hypothetical protein